MAIFVRPALVEDVEWIVLQLAEFSEFFGTKKSLFGDGQFASEGMKIMIQNHFVLIAEKQGVGPVGFIAGIMTPHLFNPSIKVLSETFWWVAEKYRSGRAGVMLLNEFVKKGKRVADWITIAVESHSPVNDRALTKRGFRLQEKSFLMETA